MLRAAFSNRTLQEVMVEFWSDHFSINQAKGDCRWLKTTDDRADARASLGQFRDLLGASAHSPAMLFNLDNTENRKSRDPLGPHFNENYARELLELHTLGDTTAYSLHDIQEVARVLSGWTMGDAGSSSEGQFVFRAADHDDGEKIVLGQRFAAGQGQRDGEQLLDLLACHPLTARHVAGKLCERFLGSVPTQLRDRLAAIFLRTQGDIRQVVGELLRSEEFRRATPSRAAAVSRCSSDRFNLRFPRCECSEPAPRARKSFPISKRWANGLLPGFNRTAIRCVRISGRPDSSRAGASPSIWFATKSAKPGSISAPWSARRVASAGRRLPPIVARLAGDAAGRERSRCLGRVERQRGGRSRAGRLVAVPGAIVDVAAVSMVLVVVERLDLESLLPWPRKALRNPRKPATADRLVFRPKIGPAGDVLVAIFLRGGMDGVYTIPPFGDRAFQVQRKAFGFSEPKPNGLINLDDFFGLHPDFAPLESLYREQANGNRACRRSERAVAFAFRRHASHRTGARRASRIETGWIGRHLAATDPALQSAVRHFARSPLRAIAMGHGIPPVLHGTPRSRSIRSPTFASKFPPAGIRDSRACCGRCIAPATISPRSPDAKRLPRSRCSSGSRNRPTSPRIRPSIRRILSATISARSRNSSRPTSGWRRPFSALPIGIATFRRSNFLVGVMQSLAQGLQGFAQDLGDRMQRVVVVVMSEFGRRIAPNDAGGTDHGRASAMLVIGGGIRGGKVYGHWPGLATDELDEQGNLRVTTDYRDVLAEIVDRRLKNPAIDRVFPGLKPKYLGFTS